MNEDFLVFLKNSMKMETMESTRSNTSTGTGGWSGGAQSMGAGRCGPLEVLIKGQVNRLSTRMLKNVDIFKSFDL